MLQKVFFGKDNRLCWCWNRVWTKKSATILIMWHGKHSSKDSQTYIDMEQICTKLAIDIFRFDFWGHGESLPTDKSNQFTINQWTQDRSEVIEYIFSLWYSSYIFLASSISMPALLPHLPIFEQDNKVIWYIFFSGWNKNADYTYLKTIGPQCTKSTYWIFGEHDTAIPLQKSISIAKAFENSEIHIVPWADHSFTKTGNKEARLHIAEQFLTSLIA